MTKIFLLSLGGAFGTILRYKLISLSNKLIGSSFAYGTLFVNVLGSFFMGVLWGISEKYSISPNLRVFLFIGILGGFTTFSTFAFESLKYFKEGNIKLGFVNLITTNLLSIAFAYTGYLIGTLLVKYNIK